MNREDFVKRIEIAAQGDHFDHIRELYTQMLRKQDVYKRQHRLCTRGGMLESFLQEPERLTNDDVMLLLKLIFHRQDTQELLKKLLELSLIHISGRTRWAMSG